MPVLKYSENFPNIRAGSASNRGIPNGLLSWDDRACLTTFSLWPITFTHTDPELDQADFDDYRQGIADRPSLTEFAIQLGLPDVSSSWARKNRKPPQEEPGVWGEMFEAVVGAIFLDADRNFANVSQWLCNRVFHNAIAAYDTDDNPDAEEYEEIVYSTRDYLDAMGLEDFPDTGWAPGDDDD